MATDQPGPGPSRSTLLIAPGGRYRREDEDYVTGCDGTRSWHRIKEDDGWSDVAAGDPGPPPVPSLLQPTWLLTGFTLETVGSLTVSGRDTLRVTATPRPGRWDGPAAGRRQVDRVEVIVDSELGILLRHEEILDGSPLRVVAAGSAAVLAMAVWLLIYRSVSAPVNRQLTAAARDGRLPGDARALQRQWDHVINARAALQTAAVAALCAALILS